MLIRISIILKWLGMWLDTPLTSSIQEKKIDFTVVKEILSNLEELDLESDSFSSMMMRNMIAIMKMNQKHNNKIMAHLLNKKEIEEQVQNLPILWKLMQLQILI